MRSIVFTTLMFAVVASPAQQASPDAPPPIRPGLWQVQSEPGRSGGIDTVRQLLANAPADQRAKLEASMKQRGVDVGGGQVHVCLSAESIAAGQWLQDPKPPGGTCQARYERPSGTRWTWTLACTQPVLSSQGEVLFASDRAYRVNSTTTMTQAGQTTTRHTALTSTWVAADCGGLQPVPAR